MQKSGTTPLSQAKAQILGNQCLIRATISEGHFWCLCSAKERTKIRRVAITKNIIKSELRGLGTKGPTYPTRARKRNLGNLEYE